MDRLPLTSVRALYGTVNHCCKNANALIHMYVAYKMKAWAEEHVVTVCVRTPRHNRDITDKHQKNGKQIDKQVLIPMFVAA